MNVYRVHFHGYRHGSLGFGKASSFVVGQVFESTSRMILLDGFPAGISPEVTAAIHGAIMTHIGQPLGWDGAEVESIEHIGRSLGPPIYRD